MSSANRAIASHTDYVSTANIFAFLYPGYFDVGAALFGESTKQPVTLGEIFTLGNGAPASSPHTGPALVLTGRQGKLTIF